MFDFESNQILLNGVEKTDDPLKFLEAFETFSVYSKLRNWVLYCAIGQTWFLKD